MIHNLENISFDNLFDIEENNKEMIKDKTIEDKYQWIEDEIEYHLMRPDTLIGSVERQDIETYVLKDSKLITQTINTSPGLFQIFNEVITNSVDEHIRNPKKVTDIKVYIDTINNEIIVRDNGGIEVEYHETYKLWVPDMIVSKLRSGSTVC